MQLLQRGNQARMQSQARMRSGRYNLQLAKVVGLKVPLKSRDLDHYGMVVVVSEGSLSVVTYLSVL